MITRGNLNGNFPMIVNFENQSRLVIIEFHFMSSHRHSLFNHPNASTCAVQVIRNLREYESGRIKILAVLAPV